MKKLKSGDPVIVIAGKNKGKVSSIVEIVGEDKLLLKGINEVKRAKKGQGFINKTLPIHISNVMYYDESAKKASRITVLQNSSGKKVRKLKSSGLEIK